MIQEKFSVRNLALALGVVAASGIASYGAVRAWLRPSSPPPEGAASVASAPAAPAAARATASIGLEKGGQKPPSHFHALALDPKAKDELEAKVDRYVAESRLSPVEENLARTLGDSVWGKRMMRLFLIPNHVAKFGTNGEGLTYSYLELMSLDPAGARAYLNEAIHGLAEPVAAGAEDDGARHLLRASLIATASMVPELSQDAHDLARAEVGRTPSAPVVDPFTAKTEDDKNASMSMSSELLAPVMAYNVLVEKAPSPDVAIAETLNAFQSQPHFSVRLAIENAFTQHFPQDTRKLSSVLKANGMRLPSEQVPKRNVASGDTGS